MERGTKWSINIPTNVEKTSKVSLKNCVSTKTNHSETSRYTATPAIIVSHKTITARRKSIEQTSTKFEQNEDVGRDPISTKEKTLTLTVF